MHHKAYCITFKKNNFTQHIKACFFGMLFFLSSLCLATTDKKNDSQTLENELRSLMPTECVFSTQFTQTKKTTPFTLTSNGILFYSCDYGLLWKSTTPFIETLIYKKNSLNFRIEEDGTREKLTSIAHRNLGKFLLHLLDGNVAYFFDAFDVTKETKETKDATELLLTPKNKHMKKAIQSISLTMLSAPEHIKDASSLQLNIRINHANEDMTDITINNIVTSQPENAAQLDVFCTQTMGESNNVCETLKLKKKAQNIK